MFDDPLTREMVRLARQSGLPTTTITQLPQGEHVGLRLRHRCVARPIDLLCVPLAYLAGTLVHMPGPWAVWRLGIGIAGFLLAAVVVSARGGVKGGS